MGTFKSFVVNTIKVAIASSGFIATFYTMVELTFFLSDPSYIIKPQYITKADVYVSTSWNLLINMALLSLFILQHSLLIGDNLKNYLNKWKQLQNVYRSIYIILTDLVLLIIVWNWRHIPDISIWKLDIQNFKPYWWICVTIHFISWLTIFVGSICMDVNELLGIKQIYYSIVNLPDPNSRKSIQLQRLNLHMRHPSFLAFIVILWSIPIMSLDRLLLAAISTLYMYVSWNTDENDYHYQKNQYIRKFHELERLRN